MRDRLPIILFILFGCAIMAFFIITNKPADPAGGSSSSVVYADDSRKEIYNEGYDDGYETGYEDGLEKGVSHVFENESDYDIYFNDIYAEWYLKGYNDALNGAESQW